MSSATTSSLVDKSDALETLAYRGLQLMAQENQLPGTLKKPAMVAMLQAKQAGDDELVKKIVEENRRYRTTKQNGVVKGEKKVAAATKRKGPGRPRLAKTPDGDTEKPVKGVNPFAKRGRMLDKGGQFERMPSTQLHSTQPLLRALLDTTPSLEYTARSVVHTNIPQQNMPFFNRPQSLPPPQQTVPIYHSPYNTERTPYYQYNMQTKMHNGSRFFAVGQREIFNQQPYAASLNETGFNDFHGGNFNGHSMLRRVSSAETIVPDMIPRAETARPEQSRFNHENPLKYTHSLFNKGPEMRANMFNGNLTGQEGWNRSNRFQFTNAQDTMTLRQWISMRPKHVAAATSSTTGFKDAGGIVISNVHEGKKMGNDSVGVYNNLDGFNQVYDLSVPKPGSSQHQTNLAPIGTGIGPENSTYSENFLSPFMGAPQDINCTQTNSNSQGQEATYEPEIQTYATLMNVRSQLPAYQNPQTPRRNQEAAFVIQEEAQCVAVDLQFTPTDSVPRCLEHLYNLRRDLYLKSAENKSRSQKENTATTTTNFYTFPLISTRTYAGCSGSEATESSPEDTESNEVEAVVATNGQSSGVDQYNITNIGNNMWPSTQLTAFDRNQYTLPQIYDYLENAEMQIGEQFHNIETAAGENARATLAQSASATNAPLANSHMLDLTPLHPNQARMECPGLAPVAPFVGRHYTGDGLVRCKFSSHGCQQVVPSLQLKSHEQGCLHMVICCPMTSCTWRGKLGCLTDHMFDVGGHKQAIMSGEKQTYAINMQVLRETRSVFFVQQSFARIFLITVAYRGCFLFVFIQEIPSYTVEEMKPPNAKGYLEIVGKDGYPYSWNGQIFPISEPLLEIIRAEQCLSIHIGDVLYDTENCFTLYEMVTL